MERRDYIAISIIYLLYMVIIISVLYNQKLITVISICLLALSGIIVVTLEVEDIYKGERDK